MEKIKEFMRHNQGMIAGILVCALLVVWGLGCQPKVRSPFEPNRKVTRAELTSEIERYADAAASAYENLDQQERIRAAILEAGVLVAQGGDISPLGLATTLMGILGVGVIYDNRKKDSVITSKNNALKQIADAVAKGGSAEATT